MKLGDLFDVILENWKVRLRCRETDLDFIAFSKDPIFEPYRNRTIQYIHKGLWISESGSYDIHVVIK